MSTKQASQLWINAAPIAGGPGEHIVDVNIKEHTGRSPRSAILTWTGDYVDPVNREIVQEGALEYAKFDQDTYMAPMLGGKVAITGVSNSKNLLFMIQNSNNAHFNSNYTAAGVTTGNGEDILGDPGKIAEYAFYIEVHIPANNSDVGVSRLVYLWGSPSDDGGRYQLLDQCVITSLSNNNYYLTVDKIKATIPASGGSTTIKVDSNTNWELSIL